MTPDERAQSLTNARLACECVTRYMATAASVNGRLKELVEDIIAGFELLDAKEQKQAEAGREFGHLGKKHGSKGGRPRKATTKGGKK
jgi:hypothetical protein